MKIYILVASVNIIERKELEDIASKIYDSFEEFKMEVNPCKKGIEIYPLDYFVESCNDEAISDEGSWIQQVLIKDKQTVWFLEQFDQHFSCSSRVPFGVFTSKEKAIEAMHQNYSKEALGKEPEFYENGTNQWMSDVLSCGIQICEVELDKFEEL